LQAAYDPSQNLRNEQPQTHPVVEAGTPGAFLKWLLQWKVFAGRYRLAKRAERRFFADPVIGRGVAAQVRITLFGAGL
jgi:hypothetical protein